MKLFNSILMVSKKMVNLCPHLMLTRLTAKYLHNQALLATRQTARENADVVR